MSKNHSIEHQVEKNISVVLQKHKITDDVFAVGVSGGADSLALVFLLNTWAVKNNKKLVALTVNHGLREEALAEAEYVASLMQKNKIEHHILTWIGQKPDTGIEEAARIARYKLIEDFCNRRSIKYLITAHHKYDQAETFIMRLQRGSGVDGLSAMSELSNLGRLEIIRPLLNICPDELKGYLKSQDMSWCEDKSNYNEDFLRVKVRHFLPVIDEKIGLSVDRIVKTAQVLGRTRDYLESQVQKFVKTHVKFFAGKIAKISISILQEEHEEIIFRVISKMLRDVSGRNYTPRADDVQRVVDNIILKGKDFKGRTLGGCEIINYDRNLWLVEETKDKDVLSKKHWEEFVEKNPHYKRLKLPYKVRKMIKSIEF